MADVNVVKFETSSPAVFAVSKLDVDSAEKVTEVMQHNHDRNDFVSTDWGAHNHITHHMVTIFSLGATPDQIQARFDHDNSWQRRPAVEDPEVTKSLYDVDEFMRHEYHIPKYVSYLRMISDEIVKKGWEQVCTEYIFSDDKRGRMMFNRLFSSYCHPFIHLGVGLEFEQPAIIAEAVAMTPVHPSWEDRIFNAADELVAANQVARASLIQILNDICSDEKLSKAAEWGTGNHTADRKVITTWEHAGRELVEQVARWQVTADDDLDEKVAELTNACAFFTGAAQRPMKKISFDFYFMHMLTSSVFLPAYMRQGWISKEYKAKILTWKGRNAITTYASRRAPKLLFDEIASYKPQQLTSDWQGLFSRACEHGDDGHAAKVIRALALGQRQCKPYGQKASLPLQDHMWLQMANMVMDAVETSDPRWIRSAGFDEAWENVPNRANL